jgi:hypothetical protein
MDRSARSLVVVISVLLATAACGGGSAGGPECMSGALSVPGMDKDPCIQNGTPCADMHGTGVATCGPDNRWSQCECKVPTTGQMMPGLGTGNVAPATGCGDNIVQPERGEECERGNVLQTTCASLLGAGATGLIMCTAQCKFDMSMCVAPMATATAGTGAGGTGARGTAGSGR